ncbi:MAG: hypothetical protein QOH15_3014 [Gaiellales bacterium]|nr:hypothetical protein [Gaiellales bacterium]
MRHHVVAWAVAWIVFFWLWMLLVGEWNRYEWIAAASAATVAATIGEIARSRAGVHARVPLRIVAESWSVVHQTLVDFGILMWVLVLSAARRKVVRGAFRAHSLAAGGDDPRGVGTRAWITWAANISPNAIAIDIDKERDLSLVHDVIPNRNSEKPA